MMNLIANSPNKKLIGAAALLLAAWYWTRSRQAAPQKISTTTTSRPDQHIRNNRDRVDEASWESFPASDPPSY